MYTRFSPLAVGALVVAAVVVVPCHSWAVFHALGPSSDEWGLKYDVEVNATSGDDLNVAFTLSDAGGSSPSTRSPWLPSAGRTLMAVDRIS